MAIKRKLTLRNLHRMTYLHVELRTKILHESHRKLQVDYVPYVKMSRNLQSFVTEKTVITKSKSAINKWR